MDAIHATRGPTYAHFISSAHAVAGYIGAFIAWMTLLKHAPVGPAFAASHLEVVAVPEISVLYFGEQLKTMRVIAALCIVLGIVFLNLSESKHPHSH